MTDAMEYRLRRVEDAVISIEKSLQALVKLEAHHAETREALERAFKECEKNEENTVELGKRVTEIEKVLPGLTEMRQWMAAGMLGTVSLVGLAFWAILLNTRHDHEAHGDIRSPQVEITTGGAHATR